jgi:hypothetical protein
MATSFRTGRFGGMTLAGNTIPITKWSHKLDKSLQDTTSTSSYDATTQQTWQEQLPGILRGDGSIDFNWDANSTSSYIINKLKADPQVAIVLQIDKSTNYASFNADLSDVNLDMPVDGVIKGTASYKTNGPVTYY